MAYRKLALIVATLICVSVSFSPRAQAWESVTHAGLTEQAAVRAQLDIILRTQFELEFGQHTVLNAKTLKTLLTRLHNTDPMDGYHPTTDGGMTALQWLLAGAAIADQHGAQHHFFSPNTGQGLTSQTLARMPATDRLRIRLAPGKHVTNGTPATQWIVATKNPYNLNQFLTHYAAAASSETPNQRSAALARALITAGNLLHILQDMGSPSHVQNDLAAHLGRIGNDPLDLGSRYEYLAAIAYGRLAVPGTSNSIPDHSQHELSHFFSNPQKTGLADIIRMGFLSEYTVPPPGLVDSRNLKKLETQLHAQLGFQPRIDLRHATDPTGVVLRNPNGRCATKYKVIRRRLVWFVDDSCAMNQLATILPTTAVYSGDLLQWLFRGEITLTQTTTGIRVAGASIAMQSDAPATLEAHWENTKGIRKRYHQQTLDKKSPAVVIPAPPTQAKRIIIVLQGTDTHKQRYVIAKTASF